MLSINALIHPRTSAQASREQTRDAADARDTAWFSAIYEAHVDRIHAHIRARVSRPEIAEDLTAQTFLRAWTARQRYQPVPGRPVLAWLFTIANNLVVDSYRRSRREVVGVSGDPRDRGTADPERCALASDTRDEIRRALCLLKPEQQLAISLRLLDGLEYAEIARLTGKSPGALRVLVCRGLATLRDELNARGVRPA